MPATTVEIKGLAEVQRKLKTALNPVREMLDELAQFALQEAKRLAKPHPADKGTLGNVLVVDLAPKGQSLEAYVHYPNTPAGRRTRGIAQTVEIGRRPVGNIIAERKAFRSLGVKGSGAAVKAPPLSAIKRWATSHGISTAPYLLVASIATRGTRGIYFMAGAAKATEKRAAAAIAKLRSEIERKWAA